MIEYFVSYTFNKGAANGNGMNSFTIENEIDSYEAIQSISKEIGDKEGLTNVVINNFIKLKGE